MSKTARFRGLSAFGDMVSDSVAVDMGLAASTGHELLVMVYRLGANS